MRSSTVEDLHCRISRVLNLVSNHLGETLPLERLSTEAALSPYHFHRVWRAIVGEPIGETIRRLRLQRAAHAMLSTHASITTIALDAGFGSSQAFARAFRNTTGQSPTSFRTAAKPLTASSHQLRRPREDPAILVEIVSLDPFTVVAKRSAGAYEVQDLARQFRVPWEWALKNGWMKNLRGIYGVPLDDPFSVPGETVRHDACLDLGPDVAPPSPLRLLTLGGGEFARVRVRGSYAGLETAYNYLFGSWLSLAHREPRDLPLFNHYLSDPDVTPEEERITDVYLPLAPMEGSA